jgi:hypothetical protein
MRISGGRVESIRLDSGGKTAIELSCAPELVPGPGQILLAGCPESLLPEPLFLWERTEAGFLAAPGPDVADWLPGMRLTLRGPLGRGFQIPPESQRLALIALSDTSARLLPLVQPALERGADVALFGAAPPVAPALLEVAPLSALPQALEWADFLALDLPLDIEADWLQALGVLPGGRAICPGQALVATPVPCGALAGCGVCAIKTRRGWRLACRDGPVFHLEEL